MMKLLALVPMPNEPGDNDNYFNTGIQRLNRSNFDAKVNWNRNANHQVWFKYSAMDALVHGDFSLGRRRRLSLRGGLGDGSTLVQIAGIGQTYTVSPTLVIDGTFGWTRFGQDVPGPRHQLRLGSARHPGNERPDPRESGMPPMHLGLSALGNPEGWNPLYRNDQSTRSTPTRPGRRALTTCGSASISSTT